MAEDSDLERTEPATAKRLGLAREDGNIPRSRELTTFAITMAGVALLMAQGGHIAANLAQTMRALLTFDQTTVRNVEPALLRFKETIFSALWSLAPLLTGLALVALFVPMLVGGWNLTFKAIEPKFSKLNPLPGIKRMFSVNAATEAVKAILKSVLIGGIATWFIWRERTEIIGLISMPLPTGIAKMTDMIITTFFVVTSAMILLVAIDVPFQLWSYHKKLRMTKEEVKQEYKEAEGSPEVKGRIRQMQREAARKRMMQEIPSANVIVTNPTHYAVAIKYDDGMRAPQVVAKGSLKLAEKIIDTGKEHRVIVMRSPSFARALYFHAELGDDIPAKLYAAAAQVLAYVFQLKSYQDNGGLAPVFPDQLDVPAELDPQSKRQQDATPP
ncbi:MULTISPECIES: flagellar biosynthesis protein FlhB [Chromobacterium]|uniref:Flagellar biosynthetic protein FlhB n=1 Tax=Chromobacterium haemolyticum TaxID=394935 RepID=A0ABS3GRE8_9NEIS|nr:MULTISPECIES: flagellar biosynthesis protein FlhB [Chromobacterium]MBK0416429.1 flagellar type III secretion system protein FlhB [Chromobacterium haemolyticum]MBO0417617.1 flagellar type III secretion system protein FlhB [Chromobacterium haemolyticum]MBO0500809.1 flagellar type III secretion system protein FlhB [Chromobacterium haemolyticum]OQS39719.1 flagellar biosynthesis protein FlhB [Chromobacterium haemolyticum]PTU68454.1 flagellar type III secretion system protein FlhB [Chromobacteriu